MSLKDCAFPSVLNTSDNDLFRDFFIPALRNSVRYDRGVGFFSSGWIKLAAQGMIDFALNSGYARWVVSPILSEKDWEALQLGELARSDDLLYESLRQNIDTLRHALDRETCSALSWLVADRILDFRLAIPRNKLQHGEFHDKFGVFADSKGHKVSFVGSYNDSIQGTLNYESIKIFSSWNEEFTPIVESEANRFERLWNNLDPNVVVFNLPDAARTQIIELRSSERPYPEPQPPKLNQDYQIQAHDSSSTYPVHPTLQIPQSVILRSYQLEAIEAWFSNNCQGILQMATGTGKTMTALAATVRLLLERKRLLVVIVCPYKHLVEQWATEAYNFGLRPLRAFESKSKWEADIVRQLQVFRRKQTDIVSVITTNASLQRGVLAEILRDFWPESLFVADEVHNVGAPQMLYQLPAEAPYRLGLSATPIRHYDKWGTEALLDYFGEVVFQLGLKDAIGKYLTPYYYHPIPVEMTDSEFSEYCALTERISKCIRHPDEPLSEIAKRLFIKRARIMNNSLTKLEWLKDNIRPYAPLKHTLFYVGDRLFQQTLNLLGVHKRIRIHEFTQRQNNRDRQQILQSFSEGELQALVAMKCLDEGVDIPPTRTAYFLASSGNPREFVQRRGRILRRSEGKEHANIFDLVSVPPTYFFELGKAAPEYGAVQSALTREYRRVKEFAELAENRYQALQALFAMAARVDSLDI